jgi:integrase
MGLKWEDINLDTNTFIIRAANNKGGIRTLPIIEQAKEKLLPRQRSEGLLSPGKRSQNKPISLRRPWETALLRAGIKDFPWHDLRHSTSSFLAARGASLLEIGSILGHRSTNTTKRYSHLTEEHQHELLREMTEDLLANPLTT